MSMSLVVPRTEWYIHANQCEVRRGRKLKGYVTEMKRNLPYIDHVLLRSICLVVRRRGIRGQAEICLQDIPKFGSRYTER